MEKVKLTVRLTPGQRADAERMAKRLGISINAVMLLALSEYVARQDKKKLKESDSVG